MSTEQAAARPASAAVPAGRRPIESAEMLSVGTELTVGDTRDTNAGDLARDLVRRGVVIRRITAVPDRLEVVADAFAQGLSRADLIVATGGLGPTPDDLTREAIAAVLGEETRVEPDLEAWLRELWRRRAMTMPDMNLKQAWVIPSATAIPNANGTAPGWWVEAPNGSVIVALPGPPREMRPMWREWALPRLVDRGLGRDFASRTYRLTGIGESAVADLLGEVVLRRANPEVATYARVEAVDVRIAAYGELGRDGVAARTAAALVAEAEAEVLAKLAANVWATDDETWAHAIGRRLDARGWTLSSVEIATGGSLLALLGDQPWLRFGETLASLDVAGADSHAHDDDERRLLALANRVRSVGGSDVGIGVEATERGSDMEVLIGVSAPEREQFERRLAFLGGQQGRARAALNAAAVLWQALPAEDE